LLWGEHESVIARTADGFAMRSNDALNVTDFMRRMRLFGGACAG
jgi:hypothetical protein